MRSSAKRATWIIASGLITISLCVNVWAVARWSVSRQSAQVSTPLTLSDGDPVPALSGNDLSGGRISVDFREAQRTVLYAFAPDCPWCAKNVSNINAIAAQSGGRYRVVGVALKRDGTAAHVAASGYTFPILVELSDTLMKAYRLGPTPEMIVLNQDGRVLRSWLGALTNPSTRADVESVLGITLPKVDSEQARLN